MTKTTAVKELKENGFQKIVCDIIELLGSENYGNAKKILKTVEYYIEINSFVDAELAQQMLEDDLTDEKGGD